MSVTLDGLSTRTSQLFGLAQDLVGIESREDASLARSHVVAPVPVVVLLFLYKQRVVHVQLQLISVSRNEPEVEVEIKKGESYQVQHNNQLTGEQLHSTRLLRRAFQPYFGHFDLPFVDNNCTISILIEMNWELE